MFSLSIKTTTSTDRIQNAAKKATFKNLGQAAANIRNAARWSMKRSEKPAAVGDPVHTKTGRAKTAVLFAAEKDSAVIGFAASIIGTGMEGHEMGGRVSGAKRFSRNVRSCGLPFSVTWADLRPTGTGRSHKAETVLGLGT